MSTLYDRFDSTRRMLIVLAKYPEPGIVKTRLSRVIGEAAATHLYYAFLADLAPRFLPQQQRLQFDVCWLYTPDRKDFKDIIIGLQSENRSDNFYSNNQISFIGNALPGLAEQQIQQLKLAQSLGYQQAVVVTTDTPHLQREAIEETFRLLESNDIVIGPTEDGGYYLLGMKNHWQVLEQVTMSTDHVANDIIQNAYKANLTIIQLERMLDIDTEQDLKAFFQLMQPTKGILCPRTWHTLQNLNIFY